ncbi:hypothetical protein DCAR_0728038 [Daucus carota subsp. sativus]|uniref:Retrovirus-related Pol polyprotein from transposon TNT 1-94-like beta-barrel domain-containing protein n=1 Tax=Daucus carota subsp. sativus TaxID=79200 RepID=A0AAF0XKC6_DAUCS|nr:hypothetical protein DCAR_0728038 [Daucus carota subsp. sativus]
MYPLPSVSQAYAYVKQDERARQRPHSLISDAPLVNSVGSTDVDSSKRSALPKTPSGNSNRSTLKCSYCNFNGHSREQCYKLIGYPPNWKKKKKSAASNPANPFRNLPKSNVDASAASVSQLDQMQQQITQLNTLVTSFVGTGQMLKIPEEHMAGMVVAYSNSIFSSVSQNTWLIDTGATDHMCCSLSLMSNVASLDSPVHVALPTGSAILVTQAGTVQFNASFRLEHVLFMPTTIYYLYQDGLTIQVGMCPLLLILAFSRPRLVCSL